MPAARMPDCTRQDIHARTFMQPRVRASLRQPPDASQQLVGMVARGCAWHGMAWRGVAWRGVAWRRVARGVVAHG
eukprot:4569436-Lingulodinium_polyedra.AAC.1